MSLIPLFTGRSNFIATGGTKYTQGGYTYHKFTSSGNFTVVSGTRTVEYLVVGGGGPGGGFALVYGTDYSYGGGGGAGGLLNGSYASGNFTITVGTGGAAKPIADGGFSSIYTNPGAVEVALSIGGGRGANALAGTSATTGGSGGGAGLKNVSGVLTSYAKAIGTAAQGNNGGDAVNAVPASSGGGGRGGGAVSSGGTGPTDGGAGSTAYSSWFDTGGSVVAAGGFGGRTVTGSVPTDFGCGGPGGATYNNVDYDPFSGSNGIVIIRYAV